MKRRQVLGLTTAALTAVSAMGIAAAQTAPGRVLQVGYIAVGATQQQVDDGIKNPNADALYYRKLLRERGWDFGRNFVALPRGAEGRFERIPEIVAEFVRLKVDVIVAGHIREATAAAGVTSTIPIFSRAGDPFVWGTLVQSYNRPGGNVNGIHSAGTITVEQKRLELLRELVPNLRRIAFVSNREWWDVGPLGKALREASTRFGLEAIYIERSSGGFEEVFAAVRRAKPDAVYFESSPEAFTQRAAIGAFALETRIPSACGHRPVVEAGCLMTYNFTIEESMQVEVDFIDRIAKGAKAGELPYHQYSRYELVVNAKTARAIGLKIPQSVLLRADRVIE